MEMLFLRITTTTAVGARQRTNEVETMKERMRGSIQSRKRVAEQVEGEDGSHDGQSGENDEMRRVEQVAARVVEHGAPTRHGREHAHSEEAQRGLGKDGPSHGDGRLNQQRAEEYSAEDGGSRSAAFDAPSERAARTYSISLACKICARARRA